MPQASVAENPRSVVAEDNDASLRAALANQKAIADACLSFIGEQGSARSLARLTALLIRGGEPIPDGVHEVLLRAQLRHDPFRLDLTRTLVGLLCKSDRPPFPDFAVSDAKGKVPLKRLLADAGGAAKAGDTLGLYANLWQAIIQYPSSPRGWAELATALAERRQWEAARSAVRTAMGFAGPYDAGAAKPILQCLAQLAEQVEMNDLDWSGWFDRLPDECKIIPFGVALTANAGRGSAYGQVPRMLQQHPGDPKALLVASVAAFGAGEFDAAYRFLRAAFEANPKLVLWEVVTKYGAQVTRTLNETQKSDELADLLSRLWTGDRDSP